MKKLLIRDGKLTINNGKIITTEESVTPECDCCGPGCPWMKICTNSEGQPVYPTKLNNFYIEVSGVPDSISADYYSLNSSITDLEDVSCGSCSKEMTTEIEMLYSLNGLSALNRIYNFTSVSNDCDNVCSPCQYTILRKIVPLTGSLSRYSYFKFDNGCVFPDPLSNLNSESSSNQTYTLCSYAFITLGISGGEVVSSSIHIQQPRMIETPGFTYLNIGNCNPTESWNYTGDFILAGQFISNYPCPNEISDGTELLASPSFICSTSILDSNITGESYSDCSHNFHNEEYFNPTGTCGWTQTITSSYLRRGINNFSVRIVRN